jgi:uncharacterized repeat protein (TIGR01451 family)
MANRVSLRFGDRNLRRRSRCPVCEPIERRLLLSTYLVTSSGDDSSPNTLRWAVLQANSAGATSTIDFQIAGSGPQVIHLESSLPALTNSVLIDGTSQPGYKGTPLIEIDGSDLPSGTNGLVLSGGGSTVTGLSLVGFSGSGVLLNVAGSNVIAREYIGVLPSGTQAEANGTGISVIGSGANTIGGTSAGSGNIISGNTGDGILIQSATADSSNNVIVGNLIGPALGGSVALGNGSIGIEIDGASSNQIGAAGSALNVISGNIGAGIAIQSNATGTIVQNNLIGVALDGQTALGNGGDGIVVADGPDTQIGGLGVHAANVIGANHGDGINVKGNTTGLWLQGNFIGTDATAQLNLGNHDNGISLAASSNTIGGTSGAAANTIYYNGTGGVGAGVLLVGNVNHDAILSNSIYKNAHLGINLGDGPTPNHAPGTTGPNNYQNYPVLSGALSDGSSTSVTGTLSESPGTTYLIQFFSSLAEDTSGFGQGQLLLGSFSVTTDSAGNATFTAPIGAGCSPGSFVSATATDPQGDTSEFCLDVQVHGQINLVLTGTAAPEPVLAGGQITYALTVSNQGSIDAHFVSLTDQLPQGVTLVSATASQGFIVPNQGGNPSVVTANLGTLPVGGTATLTIVVQTPAGTAGTLIDVGSVTSQETDPNPSSESITLKSSVELAADVSVAIAAAPDPDPIDGDLTFTVTVSNSGPSPASNVVATLPIPASATFVSASSTSGTTTFGGGQVTASLGSLASGVSATVTVVVQANAIGTLSATAQVSSDNIDPNTGNNSASTSVAVVAAADLSAGLSASSAEIADGVDFTYTVTVTNLGPSDDSNVAISDALPAGVAFVSAFSDQGVAPTFSNGVVGLALPSFPAGATATLTIKVNPTAAPGSSVKNTISATGQVFDPISANDSASLTLPVVGASDLGVTVTAQPSSVYQGQDVTYTITAANLGPADEPDAVITSQLPAGLRFISASFTQGSAPTVDQNGLFTADLGLMHTNHSATVTIVAAPTAVGTATTTFSIQGQNVDPVTSNDSAQASVSVAPSTGLAVAISPGPLPVFQLVNWTYTLVVSNPGLSDATNVTATAPLPAGAQFVSATSSQGPAPSLQAGALTAVLGTIPTGATATVTLVIAPQVTGPMALSSAVSGDEFDLNPSSEQASTTVNVAPSVSLSLDLTPSALSVLTGHPVSFTAVVTNSGPAPASAVAVAFPLASGLTFNSAAASQGTASATSGQLLAQMGQLGPNSSATITFTVTPSVPGNLTLPGNVTTTDNQLDPQAATTSATIAVIESPGILQFAASSYAVPESAGYAVLTVVRTDGSLGAAAVSFQTFAGNAIPGLDFVATSGTLSFASGQTVGTIAIPLLPDPWDNHDEILNVALSNPSGGALVGAVATASLRIIDVDPNWTPPQVSRLTMSGSSRWINSVALTFSAPLDPVCAVNPANFTLVNLAGGGQPIAVGAPQYDPTTHTVTLVPVSPLPSGRYYEVIAQGTSPAAIRSIAGTLLDGSGNGTPGSSYVAMFAQGTKLQYTDGAGNRVTLKLTGPGYLQQVRTAAGDGVVLNVEGEVPHRTKLSGSVRGPARRPGRTNLGVITGLGNFGDVRVLLTSPPFFVRQFPFTRRGRGVF